MNNETWDQLVCDCRENPVHAAARIFRLEAKLDAITADDGPMSDELDIVDRLRDVGLEHSLDRDREPVEFLPAEERAVVEEAADEIEQLRAKVAVQSIRRIENILDLTEIACHDKVAVQSIRRILDGEADDK